MDAINHIHLFISILLFLPNDLDILYFQKIFAGDNSDMELPRVIKPE